MRRRRGVRAVAQRKSWDCGVACLSMVTERSYGDVAAEARKLVDPRKARKRGLIIADVVTLAKKFGVRLRPVTRKKDYLVGRTGILGVVGGDMDPSGHWVVLKSGPSGMFIVDPDGAESWDALDYLKKHQARPVTLLVREDA